MTKEAVLKEYRIRELMEAARRVIGRHGFEGTTIDRVAEEAHVAKGTIYLYFSNKEDLLHAAVFEGLRSMIDETRRSDRTDLPPLERLRAFVKGQFEIQSSNQDFLKAFFLESKFVTFEPGARTAWHTHPFGQTLIVMTGCGRVQREGGPIEEIRPGDVVSFAPGEKHWHGAAATTAMSHIAIQ